MLDVRGITFLSLNPGIAERDKAVLAAMPNVVQVASEFRDLADTAAVIDGLDLVVTTDTAVAHLAGAMGKAVWIMLAFGCDWRWMRDRASSPWYPSARLFRQSVPDDWSGVLDRVRRELQGRFGGASR